MQLALTLSASVPSGNPKVIALRSQISALRLINLPAVTRPAVFPHCVTLKSLPFHVNAGFADGYVYIGSGCLDADVNASPWGSPFGCRVCAEDCQRFSEYAFSRADHVSWLAPLVGKSLVCECNAKEQTSHAMIIAQFIMDTFCNSDLMDDDLSCDLCVGDGLV